MAQEKIVDIEFGSVFSGEPLVEKYIVKTASLGLQKTNDAAGVKPILNVKEIPFDSTESALAFVKEKRKDMDDNLSTVANPYLIYSVKSEDNILHPCNSVYVKYGIIMPSACIDKKVPLILPKKHTSIRYDADCSGLREVTWLSSGNLPKIQFQAVPDNVRLPNSWLGKSAQYAFVDCVFFFDEPDLARDFRDDMLIQQALRRYLFYKKIEKSW